MSTVLRNAKVLGRAGLVDITIDEAEITNVVPAAETQAAEHCDLNGRLALPALVDPHVHLDKSLLGERMRPNKSGTLPEAIVITNEFKREYEEDEIAKRAERVLREGARNGTLFVRSFADVGTIGGLTPLAGLMKARERVRGLVDVQIVAFPQEGIVRDEGTAELLDEACAMGADVVGGLPWYEYSDEDARRHIDVCFELAEKHERDIHMLVDDTDDPNSRSLEYLALKTLREGGDRIVVASHCGALAAYDDAYAAKVVDLVAAAGLTVVSNAHISLMIAGRHDREPIRRGITRVPELLAAGVNVASGQDDVNDPYYPFGKPDQLEVAFMMAHAAHLSQPHELETTVEMVTRNAARALGLKDYGLEEGSCADVVICDAPSVQEALRRRDARYLVIRSGEVVGGTGSGRDGAMQRGEHGSSPSGRSARIGVVEVESHEAS